VELNKGDTLLLSQLSTVITEQEFEQLLNGKSQNTTVPYMRRARDLIIKGLLTKGTDAKTLSPTQKLIGGTYRSGSLSLGRLFLVEDGEKVTLLWQGPATQFRRNYMRIRDEICGPVPYHRRGRAVKAVGTAPHPEPSQSPDQNRRNPDEIALSDTAIRILQTLPRNGRPVGNIALRQRLGIDPEEYKLAKKELASHNLAALGAGRGGSLALVASDTQQSYYDGQISQHLNDASNRTSADSAGEDRTRPADASATMGTDGMDGPDTSTEYRKIFSDKSDPTVSDLYIRYKEGDLILQPDFQREFIWDMRKCSRLIESAILEVPLPMIYLAEEPDERESMIDGQQRLTAFFRFMDGEYRLRGLSVLKQLNGNNFASLPKKYQNSIKRCTIRATTIKKESSSNLRFDIFERLNTGAISLNDQELRNCIYRGPYNELLKELAADAVFQRLLAMKSSRSRMKDVELVLRFASFYHESYLNYTSPIKRFLNHDMEKYQYLTSDQQDDLRKAFSKAVQLCGSLFGEHAFRRFYAGTENDHRGHWEPRTFSASIYDVIMYSLARADKPSVYAHLDQIREAFLYHMTQDSVFIETIERGTSSKTMITKRFDIWRKTLDSIINGGNPRGPRCFSYELKQKLYQETTTCRICGQQISTIDDAALDHIEQYWKGGLTVPENARLAHRYCNLSRPRNE
jgi:hypothetical protein